MRLNAMLFGFFFFLYTKLCMGRRNECMGVQGKRVNVYLGPRFRSYYSTIVSFYLMEQILKLLFCRDARQTPSFGRDCRFNIMN